MVSILSRVLGKLSDSIKKDRLYKKLQNLEVEADIDELSEFLKENLDELIRLNVKNHLFSATLDKFDDKTLLALKPWLPEYSWHTTITHRFSEDFIKEHTNEILDTDENGEVSADKLIAKRGMSVDFMEYLHDNTNPEYRSNLWNGIIWYQYVPEDILVKYADEFSTLAYKYIYERQAEHLSEEYLRENLEKYLKSLLEERK